MKSSNNVPVFQDSSVEVPLAISYSARRVVETGVGPWAAPL